MAYFRLHYSTDILILSNMYVFPNEPTCIYLVRVFSTEPQKTTPVEEALIDNVCIAAAVRPEYNQTHFDEYYTLR